MKTVDFYQQQLSAKALFIAILMLIPLFLFNPNPLIRLLQCLLFVLLCLLSGKKVKLGLTLFTFITIVTFNLLLPYGKIIYSLGIIKITQGALLVGLQRAATFSGLMLLSKLALRPDLQLPTLLGSLISESFRLFAIITEQKFSFNKNWVKALDDILFNLEADQSSSKVLKNHYATTTSSQGLMVLLVIVILNAILLQWGLLYQL